MTGKVAKSNGRAESQEDYSQSDSRWVLEWLVEHRGQRRTAAILEVNRKTVALALQRDQLTGRMVHAIQRFVASLDDPADGQVFPLDQMQSRIKILMEAVDELSLQIERLISRVEAVEEEQARAPAMEETEVETDAVTPLHENEAPELNEEAIPTDEPGEPEPKTEESERRFGWWRR